MDGWITLQARQSYHKTASEQK